MKLTTIILLASIAASTLYADDCDDFSGEWNGQCTTLGAGTLLDAIGVKQDGCAAITVDDEKFELGKTSQITKEMEGYDQVSTVRPDWNAKNQFTIAYDILAATKAGQKLYSAKGSLVAKLSAANRLVTEQLTTTTHYLPDGQTKVETEKRSCLYRK